MDTNTERGTSERRYRIVVLIALAVLTLAAFRSVRSADFLVVDDGVYVVDNPPVSGGLTADGILWAWTRFYAGYWAPVTWMSHMLDVELFGLNPTGHHLINVLWHLINVLLFFLILYRATGALWRSAAAAALFAVHPLRAESVAWVAERKDVLSTCFGLLTLWTYVEYTRHPRAARYILMVLCFSLGLMTKSMLVTLPCVMLLLDFWPLRRFHAGIRHLVREKLPLFALAAGFSALTLLAHGQAGAVQSADVVPMTTRTAYALVSYVWYLGKMVWPADLAFFYPFAAWKPAMAPVGGAAAVLIGLSVLVIYGMRRRPYLATGWLWYLGTLVPVLGLIQVGAVARADRYTYIPMMGVCIMAVWGLAELADRWRVRVVLRSGAAAVVLVIMLQLTHAQAATWRNNTTLARQALRVNPGNYFAYTTLALDAHRQGRLDEAVEYYRQAIRLNPRFYRAHYLLARVLDAQGHPDEAIAQYVEALNMRPDHADTHLRLALALHRRGSPEQAIGHYLETIRLSPASADAQYLAGVAYEELGNPAAAREHYAQAVMLDPSHEAARQHLARLQEDRQDQPERQTPP